MATTLIEEMRPLYQEILGEVDGDIGARVAKVWLYRKPDGEAEEWEQVLPTPDIRFSQDESLQAGGVSEGGRVVLDGIPQSAFTEEKIQTYTTAGNEKRWIVLQPPDAPTSAYTTIRIRRDLISLTVDILRDESLSPGELTPP